MALQTVLETLHLLWVQRLLEIREMGKGFALRAGFTESVKKHPEVIITLDADGQHDPNDIPKILLPIKEKRAEIVIGSRYVAGSRSKAPLIRRIVLAVINKLTNIFLIPYACLNKYNVVIDCCTCHSYGANN